MNKKLLAQNSCGLIFRNSHYLVYTCENLSLSEAIDNFNLMCYKQTGVIKNWYKEYNKLYQRQDIVQGNKNYVCAWLGVYNG